MTHPKIAVASSLSLIAITKLIWWRTMAIKRSHQRWIKWVPMTWGRSLSIGLLGAAGLYGLTAYIILPALWRHYERNPQLEHAPKTTQTADGIPGDPINIGLVGSHDEVVNALLRASWQPADPVTFKSSVGIAKSVVLKQPYPTAPVSSLFFEGRKQDLAFEQSPGSSATTRHHVRLWRSKDADPGSNRPLWVGSATFDRSAGVSHLTGQITHHVEADIDAERDQFLQALTQVQQVSGQYQVTGVGATLQGRNGGGDWYYTDGEMTVALLPQHNAETPLIPLTNPEPIKTKHQIWQWVRRAIHR